MKNFLNFLIIFLIATLQITLLKKFAFGGVTFNLSLILVVLWSILLERKALFWILLLGILLDLNSLTFFGLYTLGFLVIFILALFSKKLIGEVNYFSASISVFVLTLIFDLIFLLGLKIGGFQIPPLDYFSKLILPEAIYNTLVSFPFFFLFSKYANFFKEETTLPVK